MNRRLSTFLLVAFAGYCLAICPDRRMPADDLTSSTTSYQPPDKLRIAVVDIATLFKNGERFKEKMDDMKKKVEAAESQVKDQQKKITDLKTEHKQDLAESPLKEKSAELMELLSKAIAAQKQEFMRDEREIYFKTMQDIDRAIEKCAQKHQIDLVLRVSNEAIDRNKQEDVLRGINRTIPYFRSNLDITGEVLAIVNSSNAEAAN